MDKNSKIGILLVGFGLFVLLNQMNFFSGKFFLAFLGIGFLIVYVLVGGRKNYANMGFLIPGLVLLALAAYTSGEVSFHSSLFFLFLSLVFWAVLLVHTFWFKGEDLGTRIWPVFPGAGLMLFSGFVYGITVLEWDLSYLKLWNYIVAAVLIGIGLRMLFKKPTG